MTRRPGAATRRTPPAIGKQFRRAAAPGERARRSAAPHALDDRVGPELARADLLQVAAEPLEEPLRLLRHEVDAPARLHGAQREADEDVRDGVLRVVGRI